MIGDWANDNAGSIELTGNLAAVGQRHLAIQNQIQQIAALQSLAEAQRRQQMENALLEERQNVLYDISAALKDIKRLFDHEPGRGYYEFLVLEEFVSPLGLEHRMFPSLEWKNHCNQTIAGISEMRSWCDTSLDEKHRRAGAEAVKQRDLGAIMRQKEEEDRKRVEAEEVERCRILVRQEELNETVKRAKLALNYAVLGLICLLILLNLMRLQKADVQSEIATSPALFVLGLAGVCGFVCAVICGTSIAGVWGELPASDRPMAKRLAVRGFGVAIFAGLALGLALLFGFS